MTISAGLILSLMVIVAILLNITLVAHIKNYTIKRFNIISTILMWVALLNIILMILVDWW